MWKQRWDSKNHHMATTIITNSVKSHQWMLRLVGESLRTGYLVSKDLPTTFLLVTKGKIVSLQGRDLAHHLNQVTKGLIASIYIMYLLLVLSFVIIPSTACSPLSFSLFFKPLPVISILIMLSNFILFL